MSGGGQQSQPPQQVSPATVQTNTQHHPQQQQPSGSLPQQTQLQQQAQYYIVQTTPSGQVLYIPTQHVRLIHYPANIYLFKVNNRNIRKRYDICSKLTIKTPERRHWRRSGVFIVNFEHISYLFLMFLLLTLSK